MESCQILMFCMVLVCVLYSQGVNSQIPADCADDNSLKNKTCCPNQCGIRKGRGSCVSLFDPPSPTSDDVRANWPHYYTSLCHCNGNYWGVDCSRCRYGYYGQECSEKMLLPRENIKDYSDEKWEKYKDILKQARNTTSNYLVVLEELQPGMDATSLTMVPVSIYNLFVWLHHYAAKDNGCDDTCTFVDYAHESTGFPTWHRQFMLWFEWEIQYMLNATANTTEDEKNSFNFRVPYWDWRKEKQSETDLFQEKRLGVTNRDSQTPLLVEGDLFDSWDTVCWYNGSGGVHEPENRTCDPRTNTGPLYRCPKKLGGKDPCTSDNSNWPTLDDYKTAITKSDYDTDPYDDFSNRNSFRNFLEGFEEVEESECTHPLCSEKKGKYLQRHLHNAVHIIVGLNDFRENKAEQGEQGVMADVAASPNDPLFINHHAMVDCIFEQWLMNNPSETYPDDSKIKRGHKNVEYIVPFFPLVRHSEIFKEAKLFGYMCELSAAFTLKPLTWVILAIGGIVPLLSVYLTM